MYEGDSDDPYERLDKNLVKLGELAKYQESNRLELLVCHAVISLFVGTFWAIPNKYSFSFFTMTVDFGPPTSINIIEFLPIGFYTSIGFVGGVFLFAGLFMGRAIPVELVGMTMIMLWDILMAFSFFISGSYAVVVYGMLGRMMWIHMKTAYRMIHVGL